MNTRQGFGLIEIVFAAATLTIVASAFTYFFSNALRLSHRTTQYIQSNLLLEEGLEVVRLLRDEGWSVNIAPLSTSTTYYLAFTGSDWISTTSANTIDGLYVRTLDFDDVYRDTNDDLVLSAASGTYTTSTKLVKVTVRWFADNATTSRSVSMFISNIFE